MLHQSHSGPFVSDVLPLNPAKAIPDFPSADALPKTLGSPAQSASGPSHASLSSALTQEIGHLKRECSAWFALSQHEHAGLLSQPLDEEAWSALISSFHTLENAQKPEFTDRLSKVLGAMTVGGVGLKVASFWIPFLAPWAALTGALGVSAGLGSTLYVNNTLSTHLDQYKKFMKPLADFVREKAASKQPPTAAQLLEALGVIHELDVLTEDEANRRLISESIERSIRQRLDTISNLVSQLILTAGQVPILENQMAQMNSDHQSLKKQLGQMTRDYLELMRQFKEAQSDREKEVEQQAIDSQVQTRRQKKSLLRKLKKQKQHQAQQQKLLEQEAAERIRSLEQQLAQQTAENGQLSQNLEIANQALEDTSQQLDAAKQELATVKQDLGVTKQELGAVRQELVVANDAHNTAKQQLEATRAQNEILNKQLDEARRHNTLLEAQLAHQKETAKQELVQHQEAARQQLAQQKEEARQQLETARTQNEMLRQSLGLLIEQVSRLGVPSLVGSSSSSAVPHQSHSGLSLVNIQAPSSHVLLDQGAPSTDDDQTDSDSENIENVLQNDHHGLAACVTPPSIASAASFCASSSVFAQPGSPTSVASEAQSSTAQSSSVLEDSYVRVGIDEDGVEEHNAENLSANGSAAVDQASGGSSQQDHPPVTLGSNH